MVKKLTPVKSKPGKPLYAAVRDSLLVTIETGLFRPGEQMPSTKELSHQLKVSLVTAHRALQELVAAGVLQRSQGRGTFVHEKFLERRHTMTKHRLGLVLHGEASIADYYHGQVLDGIRAEADALRFDLVLLRFGEDTRNECDGFLYVNPLPEEVKVLIETHTTRRHSVIIGATLDKNVSVLASVDVDNVDLSRRAVEHLLALRHRRLMFVGEDALLSNSRDRIAGFKKAVEAAGLVVPERHVLMSSSWRLSDSERSRLVQLLTEPNRPTAIFAAGYYFALDCYAAAREAGLSVPGQLSIIGVDDPPSAQYLSPALTTMSQPLIEVGQTAARHVVNQVNQAGHATGNGHVAQNSGQIAGQIAGQGSGQIAGSRVTQSGIGHPQLRAELVVRESTAVCI